MLGRGAGSGVLTVLPAAALETTHEGALYRMPGEMPLEFSGHVGLAYSPNAKREGTVQTLRLSWEYDLSIISAYLNHIF